VRETAQQLLGPARDADARMRPPVPYRAEDPHRAHALIVRRHRARLNIHTGLSITGIAEVGLGEILEILVHMYGLAERSAADPLGHADRVPLQEEFQLLKDEIDRLAVTTEFDGLKLLDGTLSEAGAPTLCAPVLVTQTSAYASGGRPGGGVVELQVGVSDAANDRILVTIRSVRIADLGLTATNACTAATAERAARAVLRAQALIMSTRAEVVATMARLAAAVDGLYAVPNDPGTM
jgi:hypothetical protein